MIIKFEDFQKIDLRVDKGLQVEKIEKTIGCWNW